MHPIILELSWLNNEIPTPLLSGDLALVSLTLQFFQIFPVLIDGTSGIKNCGTTHPNPAARLLEVVPVKVIFVTKQLVMLVLILLELIAPAKFLIPTASVILLRLSTLQLLISTVPTVSIPSTASPPDDLKLPILQFSNKIFLSSLIIPIKLS